MGKPAAIVRLLKGAKSLSGGSQPSAIDEDVEPASKQAADADHEVTSATNHAGPEASVEKFKVDGTVDLEAGIAAIFAVADAEVVAARDAGPPASAEKPEVDDAVDHLPGIESIFAMIRSGTGPEVSHADLPEEPGETYVLLSKLDRLWQNA